ncbi:hypothetical protein HK097_000935 [Rhizophlyctis rosea]|uniref:Uncharacterized protein n=1 Tax=Rhizophlyctis rosea TaxID=64517 RepID=A0AAD5S758_9FUNG|nr:hypothetical protein HK097_000935 [Rhizophlyctis rosea]
MECGDSLKHLVLKGAVGMGKDEDLGQLLTGFMNVESMDLGMQASIQYASPIFESVALLPHLKRLSNFGSTFHLHEQHLHTLLSKSQTSPTTAPPLKALILKPSRPLHIKPLTLLTLNPHLTSVQLPRTVTDSAVTLLLGTCGKTLQHLALSYTSITNSSVHLIATTCTSLISLDLNACEEVDHHGLQHLLLPGVLRNMKILCIDNQEEMMRRDYSGEGYGQAIVWKKLVRRFWWVGHVCWRGFEIVPDRQVERHSGFVGKGEESACEY